MTTYYQTTLDEPQDEHALIVAIEQRGWRRLDDEGGCTVWWRNGVERTLPLEALAGWLAAGTPDKPEVDVLTVEAAIREAGTITRRKLKTALAKRYDVTGLTELLEEAIQDGYIEDTDAGLVLVDRI